MQSQDANSGTASGIGHPDSAEWMAFLYGELPVERQQELSRHLAECANCAEQVSVWRVSMASLDEWKLAALKPPVRQRSVAFKWAAAAALILAVGFVLGRQGSPRAAELAHLEKSVAQISQSVLSNAVANATTAANAESLRLLAEYSQLQEGRRSADQRALALTLQSLETRVARLRAELETVAVNTEDGFEQTQQNMNRLVSFSVPMRNQ